MRQINYSMLRYSSTIPPAIQHHDLNGVELALASLDVLKQLTGVVRIVSDTEIELQAVPNIPIGIRPLSANLLETPSQLHPYPKHLYICCLYKTKWDNLVNPYHELGEQHELNP